MRRDKNQSEFYSKQGLFKDVLYCVRDLMFCVTTVYAIVTLLVMLSMTSAHTAILLSIS